MALLSLLAGVLAAVPAAAHSENPVVGPGALRSSRRLMWSHRSQHIWGLCDRMDRDMTGCSLKGLTCSSYLSPGPADADIEIRLGGLPASSAQEPVHLQWWAPRRSMTVYDPLATPVNCSVYGCVQKAYAKFSDAEFNGGNVKVGENGEAVIRIRTPSTYFIWKYVAIPHIHLRICNGRNFIKNAADTFYFGLNETWVQRGCRASQLKILSAHPYTRAATVTEVQSSVPADALIVRVNKAGSRTTRLPSTSTEPTTTTQTTTASGMLANDRDVMLEAARDALDLDALEFSPVYACLLDGTFFDHFSFDCAEKCPDGSAAVHGQCARKETEDQVVAFKASWKLQVACGEPCWHDKVKVTLHNLRLNVAGHLDVPFQEVAEVAATLESSTSRRLGDTKTMYVVVNVNTKRVSEELGLQLLGGFFTDAQFASQLLGLDVRKVDVAGAQDQKTASTESLNQDNDPYGPAYEALEKPAPPAGGAAAGLLGFLPLPALVGIAAGVVVLLAAAVFYLRIRSRRLARQRQEAADNAKVVAEPASSKVDHDEDPKAAVKAQQVPEEAADNEKVAQPADSKVDYDEAAVPAEAPALAGDAPEEDMRKASL